MMAKVAISLMRQAQWAAMVLGAPDWSLSGASAETLEAFVRRAESASGHNRSRSLDLFPTKDTVVAQTMRWIIDIGVAMPVKTYMDVYHGYSERASSSRSSFVNNIGPYTWGAGKLMEQYDGEVMLRKNGKPRMRTEHTDDPTWLKKSVPRHRRMVRWIGPTADQWLRLLLERDLDRAYALLERRLTSPVCDREPTDYLDETALTKRWLDRIRTEIARRTS